MEETGSLQLKFANELDPKIIMPQNIKREKSLNQKISYSLQDVIENHTKKYCIPKILPFPATV